MQKFLLWLETPRFHLKKEGSQLLSGWFFKAGSGLSENRGVRHIYHPAKISQAGARFGVLQVSTAGSITELVCACACKGTQTPPSHSLRTPRRKRVMKPTMPSCIPGTSWATVMLVLSPLAFVLGVIILLLNIHNNK